MQRTPTQLQHLIADADSLYRGDLIEDRELDAKVGDVLHKAEYVSLSKQDIEVLEEAIHNAPTVIKA